MHTYQEWLAIDLKKAIILLLVAFRVNSNMSEADLLKLVVECVKESRNGKQ